jgi:hypothetical protein
MFINIFFVFSPSLFTYKTLHANNGIFTHVGTKMSNSLWVDNVSELPV